MDIPVVLATERVMLTTPTAWNIAEVGLGRIDFRVTGFYVPGKTTFELPLTVGYFAEFYSRLVRLGITEFKTRQLILYS